MTEPTPSSSKTAILGLVFGILGLCFVPFAIVGLILGVVALTKKTPVAGGKGVAIAAVVVSPLAIVIGLGIQTAVAIPMYIRYLRQSKTGEAVANVSAISHGVVAYWSMERLDRSVGAVPTQSLPPSVPRTPAVPGPDRQPWPPEAAAGWRDLDFAPADPIAYAYEYTRAPDGTSFVVRAVGDLDGDGTLAIFEQTGRVVGGEIQLDALRIENETE